MKQRQILLLFIFLFLSSCGEKVINDTGDDDNGGNGGGQQSFYRIEIEPSVNIGHTDFMVIRSDTGDGLENGIYTATFSNLYRNVVLKQDSLHSPTSSHNGKVAYLFSARLYYYYSDGDSTAISPIGQQFSKIVYANDSILIGSYGGSIYHINENQQTVENIGSGILPTVYKKDSIAYLKPIDGSKFEVLLVDVRQIALFKKLMYGPVIADTLQSSRPRSFGIEPRLRRYSFTLLGSGGYGVYTKESGKTTIHHVADSRYSGSAMIFFNQVIFTGEDGRIYRTMFEGGDAYPFWGAE